MAGYSPIFGELTLTNRKALSRQYFKLGRRTRVIRELLDTLIGAAAGGTASLTQKRIQHSRVELGGVRVVETQTMINRASTATDVTNLKEYLSDRSNPATAYEPDLAGDGRTQKPAFEA